MLVMALPPSADLLDLSIPEDQRSPRTSPYAIGRYDERRVGVYTQPLFGGTRNLHVGLDLFGPVGEPLYALADGEICYCGYNPADGDYGHALVMRFTHEGQPLFALYGHLARSVLTLSPVGRQVQRGDHIASLGAPHENGGWPPHVHLQLSRTDPGTHDMPGTVEPGERDKALVQYPDPQMILGRLY